MVTVAGVDVSPDHFIGGERVGSTDRFAVESPIDGHHLGDVSAGGSPEVEAAVDAASAAFPRWAGLGPSGRGVILDRFASLIRQRSEELARVETEDNGSLILGNRKRIMSRSAHNIEFFARWATNLRHEPIEGKVAVNDVRYDPSGVAALIVPWNAPFMLATWKVGPALASGNTVVLKPPEWAPFTCSLMADIATEAGVPPGVFNVVQGLGEEAGAQLVARRDVARISFTGSTDTARSIGKSAAENLTPVSFELGGKSPFIVFADADLEAAAATIARQYVNAGQVCLAGTRILAESSVAERLAPLIRLETERLPIGDPRDISTRVGPLITREHFDRVSGFVERSLADGATPMFGGSPSDFGSLYFTPTLLTDVRQDSEIVQREVFGPVLTWQVFDTEEEAVKLANDTPYGLAAMVYTTDPARANRVADAIVAGTVWVNCFFVRDLAAPFGGTRESGIGREGGTWSFDFFCDIKNVSTRKDSFT